MNLRNLQYLPMVFVVSSFLYLQLGAVHIPSFFSDESHYLYGSYSVLKGLIPYKDIFLAHPPLMYWYYAGFMALFGVNLYIARIGAVLLSLGSIILLFLFAKQLMQGRPYSNAFSNFCILLYSLYPTYYGGGGHPLPIYIESLLTPFCLISALGYLMYLKSDAKERRLFFIVIVGLSSGFAIMTKLTSLYFVYSLFIFHTIYQIWAKHPWSESLGEYLSLLVAVSFVPIIIFGYLYAIGAWDNFYLQVIEWQQMRQSLVSIIGIYAELFAESRSIYFQTFSALNLATILGSFFLLWKGIKERKLTLIFPVYLFFTNVFALAFLIKTSHALFFIYLFPYQFLIAVAGIYFLVLHIIDLWKQTRSTKGSMIRQSLKDGGVIEKFFILCFLTVLITFPVVAHLGAMRVYPPTHVISSLTLNPLPTEDKYTLIEYEVGNYISSITKEGDKIWTSEPAIAFFADRSIVPPRSPNFPFQGFFAAHEYWMKASPDQIAEGWKDQPPKVIVLITGPGSDAVVPYPDEGLYDPWKAKDYLAGPPYNTQARPFIDSNYIINKAFPFETYYYQIWVLNVTGS